MSAGIYLQVGSVCAPFTSREDGGGNHVRANRAKPPVQTPINHRDYSTEPAATVSEPPSILRTGQDRLSRRQSLWGGRSGLTVRSHHLPVKTKPRVVLLQGPVGPFFSRLQDKLEYAGYDAWRICLNAGDRFFARSRKRIGFAGSVREWENWLRSFLKGNQIDHIVLLGCARPAHEVARKLATEAGIHVLCLEEGYLRPGFVTVESGGNNAYSPLAGCVPLRSLECGLPDAQRDFRSFRAMCGYGAAYYGMRAIFSRPGERALFHRRFTMFVEPLLWGRNYWRHLAGRAENFRTIERLLEIYDGRYFLVPLQVAADSQLGRPAYGWNSTRLVVETLRSFTRSGPESHRLVFKVHPLERGHSDAGRLIRQTAETLGIGNRVDVVETGSIGLLTRHSAGMITINSTSGLSAIHHGVPLLAIGNALYAHEALATCAHGAPDFDAFWAGGPVADVETRRRYLAWIAREALVPGDFYATEGMALACDGIVERLRQAALKADDATLDEALAQAC